MRMSGSYGADAVIGVAGGKVCVNWQIPHLVA